MKALKRVAALLLALLITAVSGAGVCQGLQSVFVLLNQPYKFLCDASICNYAEWRKSFPTDATIAIYRSQLCSVKDAFKEEFSCDENHLLLKRAKSTDQGTYVFVCNGTKTQTNLHVLYALKVNAVEKENITLDCTALSDKDVTWLFNNGTALYYEKGGVITPGKGFEGRVSVEKDCFRTGNFSLTITDLHSTDEGVYRCFVDQTTKGYPHTYKLDVDKKRDQTDSTGTEASDYKTTTIIIILALIVVILVIGISVLGILYYNAHNQTPEPARTDASETEDMLVHNNNPAPADNDTPLIEYPVQESNPNKSDSSVTTF